MGLDAEAVSTVEIAASLSQIGKLSISRAILNKPERLTEEELAIIQSHVEHAATVLRDLDFGLPVFDAIYQMNERLDGSGYPVGISGDEIGTEARILAVCDVFCARIEPRSYRPAIEASEAVEILKMNPTRYDTSVIEALDTVVQSPTGDKLMEQEQ
jgi:HD-GYP domain-containing protein (c-di-GMP phosphodiesterase class II)